MSETDLTSSSFDDASLVKSGDEHSDDLEEFSKLLSDLGITDNIEIRKDDMDLDDNPPKLLSASVSLENPRSIDPVRNEKVISSQNACLQIGSLENDTVDQVARVAKKDLQYKSMLDRRSFDGRWTVKEAAIWACGQLDERKFALMCKVIHNLGFNKTWNLMRKTLAIEAAGGLYVKSGTRRRTKGGVFFTLVQDIIPEEYKKMHLEDKKKKRKKLIDRAFKARQSSNEIVEITEKRQIESKGIVRKKKKVRINHVDNKNVRNDFEEGEITE